MIWLIMVVGSDRAGTGPGGHGSKQESIKGCYAPNFTGTSQD